MDARSGVQRFLILPALAGRLTAADIEQAIHIACEKSPSAAIDSGQVAFMVAHRGANEAVAIGFGKGCRWLAMIRRDEGQEVFGQICSELRQITEELK